MAVQKIGLADAIQNLRGEIEDAIAKGKNQKLKFGLDTIEMEFAVQTTVTAATKGKAKVSFWVVDAELGADGGVSNANTHRVKLTLNAEFEGESPKLSGRSSARAK